MRRSERICADLVDPVTAPPYGRRLRRARDGGPEEDPITRPDAPAQREPVPGGGPVLVLAELNPDVVVRVGAGPVRFGQVEQLVDAAALTLGSSGAITAAALAAQGIAVDLAAVVGDDPAGDAAVAALAAHGVGTGPVVRRPGRRTGMTVVLHRPDGDRALLTFPGTMADLRCDLVDEHRLRSARHLHVSSIFLQRGLQPDLPDLFARSRANGVTTSLDPGWDPEERWTAVLPLLGHLDHLLPNAAEAVRLAGALTGREPDDVLDAARALHAAGPTVVVKDGAAGAVSVGPRGTVGVPARPVAVVDTTGAGDNFDAGYLAAVLAGSPPADAVARGVACGSLAVTATGGTGRLATAAEAVGAATALVPVPAPVPEETA